ncbi:hypothetical protein [Streptomyces sp. TRM64462]|uniref:hypothetical protein n=1 Tax=Streptomyces sp. TRM64462 TaxID=2741726 RepID=UPI0015867C54|nr:hypothetical protein [Streptomyces sp. TRM64462]
MRASTHDLGFRERSRRLRTWGVVLLSAAGALWLWLAVLLFTSYSIEGYQRQTDCSAPFDRHRVVYDGLCATGERDWPVAVTLLAASLPFALAGTALVTAGVVSVRMSEHGIELERLREQDRTA